MLNCFLILGYGIPKKIERDENYNFYLKAAFNKIFEETTRRKSWTPMIIFCGGKTDMYWPYKRTEAAEMRRFFKTLANRKTVKDITKKWNYYLENQSLSTLENLLLAARIIKRQLNQGRRIFIIGEKSRERRLKILGKKIFKKVTVLPIDFDQSDSRYRDVEFIRQKERKELEAALWALKSPANFKKYHQSFVGKIKRLRAAKPSQRSRV